ncbi:MAG: heme-binding protein, partial [Gammaproteobacteria bacterium]|nr:heme-binding protein [Gammaproteobacteria bacterium]
MSPAAAAQEENVFVEFRALSPTVALELAQETLKACQKDDYQVAVAVVDRMGVTQVLLRDRYAGPHTPLTAWRKAW